LKFQIWGFTFSECNKERHPVDSKIWTNSPLKSRERCKTGGKLLLFTQVAYYTVFIGTKMGDLD